LACENGIAHEKEKHMLRTVKWSPALCLLIVLWGSAAHAQTVINAASCNESDVNTALGRASSGSVTVTVPSGTCAWTSPLSYTVPSGVTSLTIQGNTVVNCTGTPGTSSYTCAATDNTIIQDSAQSNTSNLTIATGSASTFFRITGLTIEGGNIVNTNNAKYNGIVLFAGGNSQNLRIDHCHINATTYSPSFSAVMLQTDEQSEGVLDHNVFDLGNNATYNQGFRAFNAIGDSIGNGDGTFMAATYFGSAKFIYMESNQINGGYANDCAEAGRLVERYNTFVSPNNAMQTHPTKTYAGPARGCRAVEFYHNYLNGDSTYVVLGGQGAPWMVWGNIVNSSNNTASYFWGGGTYRNSELTNGEPPNSSPPNGWAFCGTTVASHFNTTGTGASSWDGNSSAATGYPCLDGMGRGQQTQGMNGANFPNRINTVTGTKSWPAQYLEPIYLFMNTLPSGLYTREVNISDMTTTLNRDIYADNTGCAGSGCSSLTTGTGYGTLAQRPSACTAGPGGTYGQSPTGSYGVAYFATDTNTLYVCTATNSWTAVYTPYTYPHPLATGESSSDAPHPPTSLSATVQ
jgi:hypothetical protein